MEISSEKQKSRKPKLPRKRKKACIKAQGRVSYYSTVNMAKLDGDNNCKFWVNASVINIPIQVDNVDIPIMMPIPKRYW